MTNFSNYENNIEVLNEGFFDFIKKWMNRLYHSLFKVKSFEELYSRLDTLENIIKYGKSNDDSIQDSKNEHYNLTVVLNEDTPRRRRRIVEADDDTNVEATNNTNNKPAEKRASEIDLPKKAAPTSVDMDNINMNIPSFPQVAKQLLIALEKQTAQNMEMLPISKIKKDIETVKKGNPLSQRYIQTLEIRVTDFIRKYSSGTISLQKPDKGKLLSYDELKQWEKYANNGDKSDKMFAYVHNTMEQIVNDYEKKFIENFNVLKTSEDSFIKKYKDGEASKSDLQFISDWEQKITQKVQQVKTECIEYIPTAINNYFISNKIYKTASDYVLLCLQLLMANSKNTINGADGKSNQLLKFVNEWVDGDKDDIIEIVNIKRNDILNAIKNDANYSNISELVNNINDDVIENAISAISNIKNIQKYDDKRLSLISNDTIKQATKDDAAALVIAMLLNYINSNYKYKCENVDNIFNINQQNQQNKNN